MATSNQSEKEFFALVTTGRQGVESMLDTMGRELCKIAAPNVQASFDTWTQRALVEISTNENLREVISTKTGIHSIYTALGKAATMGLQIGGSFPHAYLTPKNGKAVLMPTQDGFIFATTFGPGAILETAPTLNEVYEKDTFSVDAAAGVFKHDFEPFGDRGKLVGFFTVLEFKDGRRMVPHITLSEVQGIEKGYGQINSPAYAKSLIDMHRKTAMKKMLKPIVKICEGLAMLIALDEEMPVSDPDVQMRDVSERTSARMDRIIAEPEPEPVTVAPVAVAEPVQQDIF